MPGRSKKASAARFKNPNDFFQSLFNIRHMLVRRIGEYHIEVFIWEGQFSAGHGNIRFMIINSKTLSYVNTGIIGNNVLEESFSTSNFQTFSICESPLINKSYKHIIKRMIAGILLRSIKLRPINGLVKLPITLGSHKCISCRVSSANYTNICFRCPEYTRQLQEPLISHYIPISFVKY